MTEQAVGILPTVIMSDREGDETFGFVTAWEGPVKALIVFRGPEDAFKFREQTGRYTSEEGCRVIGMDHEALDALLEREGIGYVAMPERWTGRGGVDLFTRDNFIRMLEESLEEGYSEEEG